MMRSYGGPCSSEKVQPVICPMSANSSASLRALNGVRLAMVSERSSRSSNGPDHAARGAARTEQQNALVGEFDLQIALEIADQPGPVGIVAEQCRIGEERDRIHRLGAGGARRQFVHQFGRRLLVRHGDVQAAHAAGEQPQGLAAEILRRDVEQPIDEILRRGLGEHPVDERRPAVGDRVPDDPVLIGRACFVRQVHGFSHSAARFAK